MTISTHILILLIGLIYPTYLLFTFKKTNNRLKKDETFRAIYYKQLTFIFWMLTCLVIGNAFIEESILLNFYPTFNTIGIVLAVLIFLFIGLQIVSSKVSTLEKAASIMKKTKDVYHYLPKSKHEFIWFNLLSLSAGICEEIIFRLFMFSYFLINTNLVTAFILTSIIFALTHMDTSKRNMLNAFVHGLLFTTIYYLTDNIWLPITLHSSIDISLGYMAYKAHNIEKTVSAE